jgi:chloramphenicol-sensitive protein RarD
LAESPTIAVEDAASRTRSGLVAGLVCYMLWGFLPLLFDALEKAGALTIVADRTIWSLLFVGIILVVTGRIPEVRTALRDLRVVRTLVLSSVLLAANWLIYVWAVADGQLVEASFGYFINPIANIVIGMLFLGERQRPLQVVAIVVALAAIALQGLGLGHVPYVALAIALTFAAYGFVRKQVRVESTSGLFIETSILVPVALAYLAFSFWRDGGPGLHADPYYMILLLCTGPATAIPLLLFTFAVRRLRLTTIGMLQYLSPSIQFLLAVLVLREPINATQLWSFALIWLSLAVYSADAFLPRKIAVRAP